MSEAKKLLSDRMADNRAVNPPTPAPDESYQFAGYSSGGKAFVKTSAGEVLPASIETNGYIKPGQPIDVTNTGKLSIEAMPKARPRSKPYRAVPKPKYKVKILYFIDNAETEKTEVWVGGDRFQPKKITEFPLTSDIKGLIHNLGRDDKYVISLRIGGSIHTYHDKESFTSSEEDKLKRARLNPVGHGYFAEFRDPYLLPVTVPNSAIGDFMFASFDALFPEVCSAPNVCTSSPNDNQTTGTGDRSESGATKDYSLKPWAFYKGETIPITIPMPPDAIRSQAGTYGEKANDIIETNSLTQSVLLSPNITRSVTATNDRNRVERSNGSATGSGSWYFTLTLSHPHAPSKYYEFNICSDGPPSVLMTRSAFQTNPDPKYNSTILILSVSGNNVFSHRGEEFNFSYDYNDPLATPNHSYEPYVYEISDPIEVDGLCQPPVPLPDDGPGGINTVCGPITEYVWNYEYVYLEEPCGTPRPSSPTPPDRPPGVYFESYFDKSSLHWRTAVMGDQKQVIAKRSEYAISNGPSPSPVTAINKEEYILITQSGQEIILGGALPATIGPNDNLIGVNYYWINDGLYSAQDLQKSSIKQLDLTEYNLGASTTKKISKETIYPIPNNAIVQNCSYHPD